MQNDCDDMVESKFKIIFNFWPTYGQTQKVLLEAI